MNKIKITNSEGSVGCNDTKQKAKFAMSVMS